MISVTKPYLPDIKKYNKYVKRIYDAKWLTNNGPLVQELRVRLEEYLEIKNLLLVSNGTIALNIAYHLLNIKKSVITTPFSFVATTSSLVWDGISPVFCDIDKNTLNMDAEKVHAYMNESIEAILPVHIFGNTCDVEKLQSVADRYNKKIIYDASHSFGVKYKDTSVLSFGDISTISFHATKLFHTVEGGGIVINDDELFERANSLLNFGYNKNYEIIAPGINGKMSEFHAAMGLAILDDIDTVIIRRKEICDYYYRELNGIVELQQYNKDSTRNYSYMPIILPSETILIKVLQCLNENEIFPKRYFYPSLNTLSYIKTVQNCEFSEDISTRVLCLPLYDSLDMKDVNKIVLSIKDCLL